VFAFAPLLLTIGCMMPGQSRRAAFDYGPLVRADPRSIVVAPILSMMEPQAGDWFLSTLTAPLTERGYYVFPVFMTRDIAKQVGLARGPEGGFIEFSPDHARRIAEFFDADAVLFVTLKKWDLKVYELGLDPRTTNEVLFDYLLTDASGETIWTATQGASLTRGGGNAVAQVWNLLRMAIEGRPNEMGKRTYTRPAPLLVGPHHSRYESDRARRRGTAAQ
jgi:hypothetical protein